MHVARPIAISSVLDLAIRRAAEWHRGQDRKGSSTPYIAHPFAVAMILDRSGFAENVVVAGLLHDVVEDCGVTLATITLEFGAEVASIVAAVSEEKTDASGAKRPWADRKRDHIAVVASASVEARAVALADTLHNLSSIRLDLEAGRAVWSIFNAGRTDVLAYHREKIERFGYGDARLAALAEACREVLEIVASQNIPGAALDG